MSKEYDLVVLGGGPGGYAAAIRAAQLDLQVAIVEKDKLGGTCLHYGCIPSKSLLRSAEVFQQTKKASDFGIEGTENVTLNYEKIQLRKNKTIESLHSGIKALMKKGKIDVFNGTGRILGPSIFSPLPGTISIEYADGNENTMLVPKNIIIATGSKPKTIPGLPIDGEHVLDSSNILNLTELPTSIVIIGAGVIGIEWASMLADFGVSVTVVEYAPQILPSEDKAVANKLEQELQKKGITFIKNVQIKPDTLSINKEIAIEYYDGSNNSNKTLHTEKILMAVGREANTLNIGLENTDIIVNNGAIETNEFYQTKESHIYAIGDCIGGMQLAHVATHEGLIAVEHMAEQSPLPIKYNHVPRCIYSSPEVASVGLTEEQARAEGINVKVGQFPFQANGKALVYGETVGFVKIIADEKTKDLVGVHMVGPHVTNMISEAGLAMVLDATPWEITQSIHPHPSLSEVIGEAALAVDGIQIHG
ncbi:dihydrolipoyl dehydrogenase [Virgibacillus sp. W0430]|uniref:dihydrolipoyl dehydrogenase n=1 Tax=Virgibacillus sp. W0430 TaxID=3391580 RepID=UPI003F45D5F5